MKHIVSALLLAGFFLSGAAALEPSLELTGVIAFRATTTNLNGFGIRVAQVEDNITGASLPAFEVNPGSVGLAAARFTYRSEFGTTTNFSDGIVGQLSDHANQVGAQFYGLSGGAATNVAHIDNYHTDFFILQYIYTNHAFPAAAIVNQTFTYGTLTPAEQQQKDLLYDNFAASNQLLMVSAANNGGPVSVPGTGYNCVSVGAYGGASSIGPTIDNGRSKPDICAPAEYTSFATPQISGAAAVLLQAGLRGDGGSDTNSASDPRTLKALLLNGAVKPADWFQTGTSPLDPRYGAGVLNLLNSYRQLAGGKQIFSATNLVALDAAHPPSTATNTVPANFAWDFRSLTSRTNNDAVVHYLFNLTNVTAAVTLVWNRPFGKTNVNNCINNLDLFLYATNSPTPVATSTSLVDNVEHLRVVNLPAGGYDLQVVKHGGTNVISQTETFSLAWQFVPLPALALAKSGTNLNLTWPVYPAGFSVEARTNLIASTWNTNDLPANSINANGRNSILLNKTNASQFFRLHSPNF